MPEHTRRTVLRVAGGTAVAAVATPIVPAGDDPHPAWLAEWRAAIDWCNGPGPGGRDLAEFPLYHRSLELERLIGATPAATAAGALAQLRVLSHWHGNSFSLSENDAAGLANAIATLGRLAGEARA
jgi:hypothetical protein